MCDRSRYLFEIYRPRVKRLPLTNFPTARRESTYEIRSRDFAKMKKRSRTRQFGRQVTVDALVSTFRNKYERERPVTWKEKAKSTGGIKPWKRSS